MIEVAPVIGRPRLHSSTVESTSTQAKALAAAGAPHGTVVTAGEQTGGRGRHGRAWSTRAGESVALSVVLRWKSSSSLWERRGPLVPLAAGVAVAETVAAHADPDARVELKWPNDVWIDRRKVAGVLVEARPDQHWAVLGIGINVGVGAIGSLPDEERSRAIALAARAPGPPAVEEVIGDLLGALSQWLIAEPASLLEEWSARDGLRGHHVSWGRMEGVAAGIDASGALLVDAADGRHELGAGEVSLSSWTSRG